MATGISVSDDLITTFNDFKLKRTSFRFLVMKIEKNEVVLEKGVDKVDSATWYDDFCAEYLKDTPAYVAIDFDYKTTDGRDADKVILLSWIPDTAKIKQKMSYAGTKEAVKSALVGVALNINATDLAEAGMDALTEACNKV